MTLMAAAATDMQAFYQGWQVRSHELIRSNQPVRFDTINGCGDDECLANAILHDIAYYSARERVRTTPPVVDSVCLR